MHRQVVEYLDSKYPDNRLPGSPGLVDCLLSHRDHLSSDPNSDDTCLIDNALQLFKWRNLYEHKHIDLLR